MTRTDTMRMDSHKSLESALSCAGRDWPRNASQTITAFLFATITAVGSDAPTFTSQPQNQAVRVYGVIRLHPTVTGAEPISCIWQKNGAFLSGATNVSLVISNAQASDSGVYALVAANGSGVARSSNAVVVVDTNQPCNFPWQWEKRLRATNQHPFGTALAVALDQEQNAYAVGILSSDNGWDWVAAKVNRMGQCVWIDQYDGPIRYDDRAVAVALDAAGNCYVTGYSHGFEGEDYVTKKYNLQGVEVWTARQNFGQQDPNDEAYSLAVDLIGNAYVGGNRGVLRYDMNGVPLWTNSCRGDILKLTPDGSALYTLSCYGCGLAKLNTNGAVLWQSPIPCPLVTPGSTPPKLVVDSQGNAYVAGSSNFDYLAGTGDVETVKFDQDGNRVWTAIYNGPENYSTVETPNGIQVDEAGCVHVVCGSFSTAGGPANPRIDIVTLKYDPQGRLLWAARYDGPQNREDYPLDLQVDAAGDVYVCGYSGRVVNQAGGAVQDGLIIKYDSFGSELWVSRYLSPIRGSTYLRKLALASAGNLVAVGEAPTRGGTPQATDFLVLKFDQRGPLLTPHGFIGMGAFQGCLVSPRNSRFDIQGTSDFVTWQLVDSVTNLNGLVPFFDFNAAQHRHRCYRAVQAEP